MKSLMGRAFGTFLKGLFALLPVFLSVYVFFWILKMVERMTDGLLEVVWPASAKVPGSGVVVAVGTIYLLGLLLDEPHVKRILKKIETPLTIMPLVKTVYFAVKDLMSFLAPKDKNSPNRVVVVKWPQSSAHSVGLLTRADLRGLPSGIDSPAHVAVYFPMSYQLGGFTLFVPKEWVKPVQMDVETAIKSSLTAWVNAGEGGQSDLHDPQPGHRSHPQ